MRIAHVTATFPPYYAGTGMVCYHNAQELARRGHQVTVFTAAYPPGDFEYPAEFTVKRLPVLLRFGNAPLLPNLLQMKGFDIIHLHHPFIFGAEMVWAVSKLRKIPYVLTHHNDLIGNGLRRYIFDLYSAVSIRLVFSGARKFAVVSLDHANGCRLANLYSRRWSDVVEVPNGVDTGLFKPGLDGTVIRKQHGIPAEASVTLFVGALDRAHHFKGADLLLKAFAAIKDREAVLVFIGDGDLKVGLIAMARSLGLSDRVYFLGAIANENLPPYYAMADVVVLPSIPPESFGMVLIESMACGTPVIASNLPGVRTVVADGQDGYLVEPGDVGGLAESMRRLLDDPLLRREMGQRGRVKVEAKYTWPVVVDRLETIYLELKKGS
jgi:glycosyltransferase involved in cell wall biosynthesis